MDIIPRWKATVPSPKERGSDFFGLGKFFEGLGEDYPPGLTLSSDDKNIYIEADVPGLSAKEVDVDLDQDGVLWIKGQKQSEEKAKKYYKKARQEFCYCVQLGDEVDDTVPPQAVCKNGVMKVTFAKKKGKKTETKKIPVKEEGAD